MSLSPPSCPCNLSIHLNSILISQRTTLT
jgi:hypothetical protein